LIQDLVYGTAQRVLVCINRIGWTWKKEEKRVRIILYDLINATDAIEIQGLPLNLLPHDIEAKLRVVNTTPDTT
jgi:hypothetical protein